MPSAGAPLLSPPPLASRDHVHGLRSVSRSRDPHCSRRCRQSSGRCSSSLAARPLKTPGAPTANSHSPHKTGAGGARGAQQWRAAAGACALPGAAAAAAGPAPAPGVPEGACGAGATAGAARSSARGPGPDATSTLLPLRGWTDYRSSRQQTAGLEN